MTPLRLRLSLTLLLATLLCLLGWREARVLGDPCTHTRPGSRCITVAPDVRLRIRAGGSVAVLLIPGYGDGVESFDSLAPRLAPYRVIAVAPRWHPGSDAPATGYSLDTLAADLVAVMDSLGIQRAHLVGHSFGGALITAVAVRYPARVLSVAYLDAAYDRQHQPPGGDGAAEPREMARYAALVMAAPADYARIRAPILALYAAPPVAAFRPIWRPWYERSRAALLAAQPAAVVATLDSTGHYLQRTRPDTVAALLTAFWGHPLPTPTR